MKRFRKEFNLTQAELSEKQGVHEIIQFFSTDLSLKHQAFLQNALTVCLRICYRSSVPKGTRICTRTMIGNNIQYVYQPSIAVLLAKRSCGTCLTFILGSVTDVLSDVMHSASFLLPGCYGGVPLGRMIGNCGDVKPSTHVPEECLVALSRVHLQLN